MTDRQPVDGEGAALDALLDANVQFVVVGEPGDRPGLRLVVSRHPTNLHALGALLERLEASLRTTEAPAAPAAPGLSEHEAATGAGVRRIGDPYGTVSVRVLGVDIDFMFGGPRRSLYAETLEVATGREIFGRLVKWAPAAPDVVPPGRTTGTALGRRLLSIAEGLAHLVERAPEPPATSAPPAETTEPSPGTEPPGTEPPGTEPPGSGTPQN